jgi:predicted RNA binding protein YcfA (HicA-like mRNA interferase family)
MQGMSEFPSMKASALERLLMREPLNYSVQRRRGSHRRLVSPGFPALTFAYHDGVTIASGLVRKILVKDIGLSHDEALSLIRKESR